MAEPVRRYVEENEVNSALRAIGDGRLTREVLMNALIFSEAERNTCTAYDPGIMKGILGWGRLIRSLREQLCPHGWQRREPYSLPLTLSPDGKVAVTVAAGDEGTCNVGASFALTKWRKGNRLLKWVEPSRQMSMLNPELNEEPPPRPDLWIFLVRRTATEVFSELSMPTSVAPGDQLRFGGARIFLQPIPIDQILPFGDEDEGDEEPPTNVPVERI